MSRTGTKSQELLGWFWPPGEDTEKLPGRLTMEPSGEMQLEVINQDQNYRSPGEALDMPLPSVPLPWYLNGAHGRLSGVVSGKTVSGRTVTDAEVTLDDCHLLTVGVLQQPRQVVFTVNSAYIGVALAPDQELLCSRISWVAEGIEGWLNPGGPGPSSYESFRPPSVSVTTAADLDGLGSAQMTMGLLAGFSTEKGNAYEVAESGYAVLHLDREAPWDQARYGVHHAHLFLRFSLDRSCAIRQLMVEVNGQSVEVVTQGMRRGSERPYRPSQVQYDALFTADPKEAGVVGDPAAVLRRWLEIPRAAQGTLLRLDSLMDTSAFLDTRIVSACGAGELWYSQILEEADNPYEPLPTTAQETIHQVLEEHGWGSVYSGTIRAILNGRSTGERVRRMFDPIEREVSTPSSNGKCQVSTKLLGVRHPWSHGGVALDDDILSLSKVLRKAKAILTLRVLDYLGVDWRSVAKYNRTIQWELDEAEQRWHALPYPIYAELSPLEASLRYLRRAEGARTLKEITDAIVGGGRRTNSKNPARVVSHQLTKHMREGGPVERVQATGGVRWRLLSGETR